MTHVDENRPACLQLQYELESSKILGPKAGRFDGGFNPRAVRREKAGQGAEVPTVGMYSRGSSTNDMGPRLPCLFRAGSTRSSTVRGVATVLNPGSPGLPAWMLNKHTIARPEPDRQSAPRWKTTAAPCRPCRYPLVPLSRRGPPMLYGGLESVVPILPIFLLWKTYREPP